MSRLRFLSARPFLVQLLFFCLLLLAGLSFFFTQSFKLQMEVMDSFTRADPYTSPPYNNPWDYDQAIRDTMSFNLWGKVAALVFVLAGLVYVTTPWTTRLVFKIQWCDPGAVSPRLAETIASHCAAKGIPVPLPIRSSGF